jgi:diketogulonate reductase-like aldo/keto reductase
MKTHNIKYQTYGPLGPLFRAPGGPVDAVVERIAAERGIAPGQVLLLWAAQFAGGTVVT